MFRFDSLDLPIVGAPMAGGVSTPALTAAVSEAGGFGFFGGAYLSANALTAAIGEITATTSKPFGVNLFVPERVDVDVAAFDAYRARLTPLADRVGATLPESVPFTDDSFDAKVDVVLNERPACVSFTFGLPDRDVVERLHEVGVAVSATVTTIAEARLAAAIGVDSLCAQGFSAGGHRAMFAIDDVDPEIDTLDLVREAVAECGLPTVGAGGVAGPADVRAILDAGAVAAQVGTLLLRTPEAGTRRAHREALRDPRFTHTVTTRAYSGRLARGLENDFIRANTDTAPAAYPQVNTLTGTIRRAAADDPHVINLWAGSGFHAAEAIPAGDVVRNLTRF